MNFLRRVELYYDVVSPYTYFAFVTLLRYSAHHKIELELKPFFLGGVMAGTNNKPPGRVLLHQWLTSGLVPAKGKYMLRDLARLQNYFDVHPLKMPSRFLRSFIFFLLQKLSHQYSERAAPTYCFTLGW